MTQYERYRQLSASLEYSFKAIRLNHVIALELWGKAKGSNLFSWRSILKIFLAYDFNSNVLPNDRPFIATNFSIYGRKDHAELFDEVIKRINKPPYVYHVKPGKFIGMKFTFNPLFIARQLLKIFSIIRNADISFFEKCKVTCEYLFICNTILELDKTDWSKTQKYLCMCHVISIDNLLTQFFRSKGIPTYSLQEGIYFIFKKNPVMGSIAYELFATDHLLCWGQYTKDEYAAYGIDPTRIDVAGYPKCNSLKPLKANNSFKSCLIILAGPIFGDVNDRLLDILEILKGELTITLKSHPANYDIMEAYAKKHAFNIVEKEKTMAACLNADVFDFCIAVNTTAYYEAWMSGIPCIRYYDERFDLFNGFDDLFSTKEQLLNMLDEYRKQPKSQEDLVKMLEYSIGFGLDNYNRILSDVDVYS